MFVFQKICRALFSCNTRYDIRPFALLPTNLHSTQHLLNKRNIKICDDEIEKRFSYIVEIVSCKNVMVRNFSP